MKCVVRVERPGALTVDRDVVDGRDVADVMGVVRTALRDAMARAPGACVSVVVSVHPVDGCEHELG